MVSLRNVSLRSGAVEILRDVSLDFPTGRSTVVVGPSGCGKSTLLKVAAGIVVPDEGEVFWDGKPLAWLAPRDLLALRKTNGFVFQDAALWANKSLADNLALPLRVQDPAITEEKIREVLGRLCRELGFADSLAARPAQLSIGEQKIVSFMRGIVSEPTLLFVDEPTASVDHAMEDRMIGVIKRLHERGTTLIVVTHSSKLASLVADNVVVMRAGEVLESGPTPEVVRTRRPEVLEILSEILTQAATYDRDLLDLLGSGNEG